MNQFTIAAKNIPEYLQASAKIKTVMILRNPYRYDGLLGEMTLRLKIVRHWEILMCLLNFPELK